MKRFAVEITEDGSFNYEPEEKVIIEADCFRGFIEIAKRIDVWDDVLSNIPIQCDKCDSFIIDIFTFYDVIEDVIGFMESNEFKTEFESYESVYNRFFDLRDILGPEFGIIDDSEESEEVAIIFDNKCPCNALFVGKAEQRAPTGSPDAFSYPDGKVTKWIGPNNPMELTKKKKR